MEFKNLLNKIESSKEYESFKKEHPEAEICAGFFILDFLSNDDKSSIDYKDEEKIFTFNIEKDKIRINEDKLISAPNLQKLDKIDTEIKIDIKEIKNISQKKAQEKGIGAKFNKIIAILQNYTNPENQEKFLAWNLTCMLDQLIILHIIIEAKTGNTIKFERKSFMDLVKQK